MVDYSERVHLEDECFDTIGDIFTHPTFQKALKNYKKKQLQDFPNADYKGITDGELLREIFSPGEGYINTEVFLKCLKKELFERSNIPDIRLTTALILSIQSIRTDISDGPSSIQDIVSEKILNVIGSAKGTVICQNDNEEVYYQYDGIRNLLEIGFPCITKSGKIVYYLHAGSQGRTCVWDPEEKEELWIDLEGEVLDAEGIERIDAAYKKSNDEQGKKKREEEKKITTQKVKKLGLQVIEGGKN